MLQDYKWRNETLLKHSLATESGSGKPKKSIKKRAIFSFSGRVEDSGGLRRYAQDLEHTHA